MEKGPGLGQEQSELDGSSFESIEDGQMEEAISKLTEVVIRQTETQRQMAEHQAEFQQSIAEVLKSHVDQLAAQVAMQDAVVMNTTVFQLSLSELLQTQDDRRKEFDRVTAEVLA